MHTHTKREGEGERGREREQRERERAETARSGSWHSVLSPRRGHQTEGDGRRAWSSASQRERETETDRDRERETDREGDREREREIDRETESKTCSCRFSAARPARARPPTWPLCPAPAASPSRGPHCCQHCHCLCYPQHHLSSRLTHRLLCLPPSASRDNRLPPAPSQIDAKRQKCEHQSDWNSH